MAYYAALISLVQLLEDIIHRDRYQNLFLNKQQIASVYEKFSLLKTLLGDYSLKDREAANFLERRIRDASYQAQDILEIHISNQMPQQLQELEEVKEEVNSIVAELMRIKESHTTEDLQLNYYSANAGTSNQASGTNTMKGFEEYRTTIMEQLCGVSSKRRGVVSIVGMGGIGKTTLARNIFDDELTVYRFDRRAWVNVSQDYHLQKILLDILDSMNETIDKSSGVGELKDKIYKRLKGKRYLIIIDDMWDTKVWDDMNRIFPDDSNGSRIMITTRISDVALYADRSGFYHQMQFLNEDQSWNLFCEKVFCPPELEDIGRLIAKNCRGLPLAIVVVAGLLTKVNKTRRDWEEVARNGSSAAAENDEDFSKILSLSYNHLPHHLKPLLLYIGGFPEDYEIRVSKLTKLWIAEGFLRPIESKTLEAVAEAYLEDLVNRNLVLITKKSSDGKIKCCGIHDLLRDLCTEIISYENFLHVMRPYSYFHSTAARNVRRLYIRGYFRYRSKLTKAEECISHVRSIITDIRGWKFLFGSWQRNASFKVLRILDAIKIGADPLPAEIWELFHLRYLAITKDVFPIPPSIALLQNLQTLIIESDIWKVSFCSLPSQIREMRNLRHIVSSKGLHFEFQFFDERNVGEPSTLENLQTLSRVYNVRFTNEVIEMIPNLRKLKVSCYEEAAEWQKFRLDNLFHLRQLETLDIDFRNTWRREVNPLPENFVFPLTLKKLSLRHCRIPWKDMTMVGSLPNLQVLKLRNSAFVGEMWEPVEEEFPQLKFLLMEELELMHWEAEDTHFPTLKHLKINYCHKLQKIPLEIGEISTLELIEVNSSRLAAKSALRIQEEQRVQENVALQVRVDFRERETSERMKEIQEEES